MVISEQGAGVRSYHLRQVALLAPRAWRAWLDHAVAATDLIGPALAGSVVVRADRMGGSA